MPILGYKIPEISGSVWRLINLNVNAWIIELVIVRLLISTSLERTCDKKQPLQIDQHKGMKLKSENACM